jgi:Ran GTPase-activating protein (RanGAP) involved in mRNA processing and transport
VISTAKPYAKAVTSGARETLPGYGLSLWRPHPGFNEFLACGELAGARSLTVYGVSSTEMVRALGALPDVRGVRELELHIRAAEPGALAVLAAEPNWTGLTTLTVRTELHGTGAVRFDLPDEFFRSPHLRNLMALTVGIRNLSGRGVAGLVSMGLARLRKLDLRSNEVDASGAAALAAATLPELRDLNLGSNALGDVGARALADGRKLNAVAVLDLSSNRITDPETMSALITGPAFPVLTGLSLRDNRIRELAPARLATPGRGPTLRLLSLRHCALSARAAAALATAPALAGLVGLDLAGNELGDEGAAALARTARWERVTCLDLGENGITGSGVKELISWPGLANLARLDLGGNSLGLEGAETLAGCAALKKCRTLVVPHFAPQMPPSGLKLLKQAFGRRLTFY